MPECSTIMKKKIEKLKIYKALMLNNIILSPRYDSYEECRASYLFLGGLK